MRAILVLLASLFAAPPANAAVVYNRGTANRSVYIANDDGTGSRKLTAGEAPHISPDGQAVIYVVDEGDGVPELREIPAVGGESKLLVKPFQFGSFAWSADGRYVAVESYRLNHTPNLVLVDRTAGTTRTVAKGTFYGATFSPDSTQLLYARTSQKNALFPKSNLEVVPTAGGTPRVLFSDGHALYPLWGPKQIAFSRWQKPPRKGDAWKLNLWLVNFDGSGRRQLTHDKPGRFLDGLTPTEFSADGTRLLTQFGGQDTTYVVTVDPATGKEKVIGSKSEGFFATGLSADGSTIIGSSGGFEWPGPAHIVTAPYTGGKPATLIARGDSPSWNR